jgi:hypothetical protein
MIFSCTFAIIKLVLAISKEKLELDEIMNQN